MILLAIFIDAQNYTWLGTETLTEKPLAGLERGGNEGFSRSGLDYFSLLRSRLRIRAPLHSPVDLENQSSHV